MTRNTFRINYLDYPQTVKIVLFFYIIGFAIGTTTHTMDLVKGGFLPYNNAPLWKNIYWTSLTLLDFLAIILILNSVVPALILSNLIIISDVIINSIGVRLSDLVDYGANYKLIMQMIFCIFILITTPILLRQYKLTKNKLHAHNT
jgi:hypothetical protein